MDVVRGAGLPTSVSVSASSSLPTTAAGLGRRKKLGTVQSSTCSLPPAVLRPTDILMTSPWPKGLRSAPWIWHPMSPFDDDTDDDEDDDEPTAPPEVTYDSSLRNGMPTSFTATSMATRRGAAGDDGRKGTNRGADDSGVSRMRMVVSMPSKMPNRSNRLLTSFKCTYNSSTVRH